MTAKLVGPQILTDGSTSEGRIGRGGELIISDLNPRYYEQAKRGNIYAAQTAVTGVAPGTAIGTTAAFALANPSGSGFDLVILQASLGYVSGTLGAGVINWVGHTNPAQAAVTGTAISVVAGRVSGSAGVGKPLTTATVPASGTPFRNFASMGPALATTAVFPFAVIDSVDGAIIVAPGTAVSLQMTGGAGTSPLVTYACVWMEVPI